MARTLFISCLLVVSAAYVAAFSSPASFARSRSSPLFATATSSASDVEIQEAKQLLCRAAETKLENPDRVLDAMMSLEKNCKLKFREDPKAFAEDIVDNISGDWRLIFTTGTKERQEKSGGRVNYFPLKAIQKFDATVEPKIIENAIYAWSLPREYTSYDMHMKYDMQTLIYDIQTYMHIISYTCIIETYLTLP